MKIEKIVAFGCSWTYGDELLDPALPADTHPVASQNNAYRESHCFAGLVAKHYNLKLENLSFPGGSLDSMRYALYWAEKTNLIDDSCLILCGITSAQRVSFFNNTADFPDWNKFAHSPWYPLDNISEQTVWHQLMELWYTNCHCDEWEKHNLDLTIRYFERLKNPLVFLPIFRIDHEKNNFQSQHKCDFVAQTILDNSDCFSGRHPNEKGHQKIANRLINYIDSVKLII